MRQHDGLITDLGNVIIAYWLSNITPENFDTIDYNSIPEVPGSFESLMRFNVALNGRVTVAYKATNVAETKILAWFRAHRFSERTGIPMDRVVRSVSRGKTAHLAQFGETYPNTSIIVDDRLEVLSHFVEKTPYLFLFRPQPGEIEEFRNTGALAHATVVQTWQEIEAHLLLT
jgi:hypothetical protein